LMSFATRWTEDIWVIYCSKDFYLLVHYIITRSLFMIT